MGRMPMSERLNFQEEIALEEIALANATREGSCEELFKVFWKGKEVGLVSRYLKGPTGPNHWLAWHGPDPVREYVRCAATMREAVEAVVYRHRTLEEMGLLCECGQRAVLGPMCLTCQDRADERERRLQELKEVDNGP
jgi:hypothetical protein